jgi:hypothetical protein
MLLAIQKTYKNRQNDHELMMGDGVRALATATVAHVLRLWLTVPSSSAVGRPLGQVVYMSFKSHPSGLTRGPLKQRAGREPKEQDLNPETLHVISCRTVRGNSKMKPRRKETNLETAKCIDHYMQGLSDYKIKPSPTRCPLCVPSNCRTIFFRRS